MTTDFRRIRSVLAVPGATPELFPKAARSGADQVFLDLEDAVAPGDKAGARPLVADGIASVEWPDDMTLTVRVNAPGSPWFEDDLAWVIETGQRLDTVLIPKVDRADELLAVIDALAARPSLGLEVLIESAAGFLEVGAIAGVGPPLEALHFGAGDFAASMGARSTGIGRLDEDGRDPWASVKVTIVAAARSHGLRALDSAYDDFRDEGGYREVARRAASVGFDGKWAIHPGQVSVANEVFSPSDDELAWAQRVREAMEEAAASGRGAAQLDGVMIDAATARLAERYLA